MKRFLGCLCACLMIFSSLAFVGGCKKDDSSEGENKGGIEVSLEKREKEGTSYHYTIKFTNNMDEKVAGLSKAKLLFVDKETGGTLKENPNSDFYFDDIIAKGESTNYVWKMNGSDNFFALDEIKVKLTYSALYCYSQEEVDLEIEVEDKSVSKWPNVKFVLKITNNSEKTIKELRRVKFDLRLVGVEDVVANSSTKDVVKFNMALEPGAVSLYELEMSGDYMNEDVLFEAFCDKIIYLKKL